MELFFLLVFWALLSWGVSSLATSRGRSGTGFFLLSFFLSPLLGLIVVLVMSDLAAEEAKKCAHQRDEEARDQLRKEEHERQLASITAISSSVAATKPAGAATEAANLSVSTELTQLAALRDKGVLTEGEFQAQKANVLKRAAS